MDTYEIEKKRGKIVDLSKISIKKIRELIVFTALLVVALWKFDVVLGVLKTIWDIIFPFVLGGAIAFLTNVPMSFLEKKIFEKVKKKNKIVRKLKRPISLILFAVPGTLTIFSHRMTIVRVLGSEFLLYHFGIKAVIISKYHRDTN